jgi:ABC-type sugar transport system permease subunit
MSFKERLKKKYNLEERHAIPFNLIMIGIPFVFFLVFWVYVNLDSILLAFQDDYGNFTFRNIEKVFKTFTGEEEELYINSVPVQSLGSILGRTVLLWFLVNVVCVLPSMLSSYILYKKIFGHYVFRMIFMIPSILAGIVWVAIMKKMVDPSGPIIAIAQSLGVSVSDEVATSGLLVSLDTSFATIVVLNVLPHIVGFNIIISGAYARIPGELFEVGRLEGVGFIHEFFRVAVPLVWPTVVVCMIGNLATIFTFDGQVYLYTELQYNTGTIGSYLYLLTASISNSNLQVNSYGYPAAVGVVLTVMTIPAVLIGKYGLERAVEPVEY